MVKAYAYSRGVVN